MYNNRLILCYNYDMDFIIQPIQGDECEVS